MQLPSDQTATVRSVENIARLYIVTTTIKQDLFEDGSAPHATTDWDGFEITSIR